MKGAFTGAIASRPGKFQQADKGTLFLDEIGELPLNLQVTLPRALQERVVFRVGDSKPEKVDIRVVAATNRNLEGEIRNGNFREDLYYRLNVVELNIPPLRERPEDILPLASLFIGHFTRDRTRLSSSVADCLIRYPWPGNVRELKNFCELLMAVSQGEEVDEAIAKRLLEHREQAQPTFELRSDPREVERALAAAGGNMGRAARILGIHRATLWRRRKRILSSVNGK